MFIIMSIFFSDECEILMEDLKIEAVFSLASPRDATESTDSETEIAGVRVANDKVSALSELKPEADIRLAKENPTLASALAPMQTAGNDTSRDSIGKLSIDTAPSSLLSDLESPPSLQLEGASGSILSASDMGRLDNTENSAPPVLEPYTMSTGNGVRGGSVYCYIVVLTVLFCFCWLYQRFNMASYHAVVPCCHIQYLPVLSKYQNKQKLTALCVLKTITALSWTATHDIRVRSPTLYQAISC